MSTLMVFKLVIFESCILDGLHYSISILFNANGISENVLDFFSYLFSISGYRNTPINCKIHPWFVTGFCDGESSFGVSLEKTFKCKSGWQARALFQLGLHKKDRVVLENIKSYFGVGQIYEQDSSADVYKVQSVKDFNVIIDHFSKYPLITQKRGDFELWKLVVEIIQNKEHLTMQGLQKIVAIRATLNRGLTDKLKAAFPDVVSVNRPLITSQKIYHPQWLSGFTSGEGSFWIEIAKSKTKLGVAVNLKFKLAQHVRDEQLFMSLVEYLGCGKIYFDSEAVYYRVAKYSGISEKIIPFFFFFFL